MSSSYSSLDWVLSHWAHFTARRFICVCVYFVCFCFILHSCWWWSGVVVSALASINEVNQRRARLVLRRMTASGFNSRCRTFISVCNQPATQGKLSLPSLGKWVPVSAGKAKAGMVHSASGWTRGVQVKLWDPLRTRAIPERLRGVFTTRRYTNTRLPYLTLPCCITVSAVRWTWWDWSLILWTCVPSVLWHCWFGHLTRKNPSPIWPIMCLVGR